MNLGHLEQSGTAVVPGLFPRFALAKLDCGRFGGQRNRVSLVERDCLNALDLHRTLELAFSAGLIQVLREYETDSSVKLGNQCLRLQSRRLECSRKFGVEELKF